MLNDTKRTSVYNNQTPLVLTSADMAAGLIAGPNSITCARKASERRIRPARRPRGVNTGVAGEVSKSPGAQLP